MKIAFFGTPELATIVLDELEQAALIPNLIVTNPDAKVGRKQVLTPPPAALWAKARQIPLLQPDTLKNPAGLTPLTSENWDLFIVVAYGKIIPQWLLDLPQKGTINVHPSLLPKLRGASPIRSAILEDVRNTGVTIMLLDEKMDHGPLLAQQEVTIAPEDWPVSGLKLDHTLAKLGGKLLVTTIKDWLAGNITPQSQDHAAATFCTKISKEMSELKIDPHNPPQGQAAYDMLCKIRAFAGWPETFFIHNGKRLKIKAAELDAAGKLNITRIIPEGKNECDFAAYFK